MHDGEALGRAWKILDDVFPTKAENEPEEDRLFQESADEGEKRSVADQA